MLYSELTKKAMLLAYKAHKDQYDKCGVPYIFHPIHLAEQMQNEDDIAIALLHDVVEDTEMSFEYLLSEGFSKNVIDALQLLTHDKTIPYSTYIRNIKNSNNISAITVKLADLRHNSDLSRLDNIDVKALKRNEKYVSAIAILLED